MDLRPREVLRRLGDFVLMLPRLSLPDSSNESSSDEELMVMVLVRRAKGKARQLVLE